MIKYSRGYSHPQNKSEFPTPISAVQKTLYLDNHLKEAVDLFWKFPGFTYSQDVVESDCVHFAITLPS